MTQQAFIDALSAALASLPPADRNRSLDYYREIIGDRMEEGCSEEEAVAALGDPETIAKQILDEPQSSAKETAAPAAPTAPAPGETTNAPAKPRKGLRAWEIILLILGAPLWLPLVLTGLILLFAFFLVLWVLVLCLYLIPICLFASGSGFAVGAFFCFPVPGLAPAALLFGSGLILLGLAILLFFAMGPLTAGTVRFTKFCFGRFFGHSRKKEAANG